MNIENHLVVDLDDALNRKYSDGQGDRCNNCKDVILLEHVWDGEIVCSTCYEFLSEEKDARESE